MIIRGWPLVFGRYPGSDASTSSSVGQCHSIGFCRTSFGTSTRTGPGRPVEARWNAWRMASGISSGVITNSLCFVAERVMPTVSHSWKASLPIGVRRAPGR